MKKENNEKRGYVAYYRVSRKRQEVSGLGLADQRMVVERYVGSVGGVVVGEYRDIEGGKRGRQWNRVGLASALDRCREEGLVLVIAKMDRLARNASFTLALKDSGVDFVCCDMPEANRMVVGFMALMAENEGEMISSRVRAAMDVKRRRGDVLGNSWSLGIVVVDYPGCGRLRVRRRVDGVFEVMREISEGVFPGSDGIWEEWVGDVGYFSRVWAEDRGCVRGGAVIRARSLGNRNNLLARSMAEALVDQGMGVSEIAVRLNGGGFVTARGGKFSATQVGRLLGRYSSEGD